MTDPCFYVRCDLCKAEIEVAWGPETHEEARRELAEHVEMHAERDLVEFARRILLLAVTP